MRNTIRTIDVAPLQSGLSRATNAATSPTPLARAFGSIFCLLPATASNAERQPVGPASTHSTTENTTMAHPPLTAEELAICERTGISPVDFAKAKAEAAKEAKAAQASNAQSAAQAPGESAGGNPAKHLPLTPEELAMCERLGITPEAFAKAKRETAQQ